MSRRLRIASWSLAAVIAAAAALYLAGPVYRIDGRIAVPSIPQAGVGADALERGLRGSEARYTDIVPGAEKTIVWAHADRRRTPLSIIYLHGYTATRQEVAPLCDRLAAALGANLYYARLTGHGRSPAALGDAEADDWQIGRAHV